MCIRQSAGIPPFPLRGLNLLSRVVPHLRGERGEYPVIPPVHLKKVALPRQRSSRTLKTFTNLSAYIVCFLQLRDFCISEITHIILFDRFFNLYFLNRGLNRYFDLWLRDFLNQVFKDFLK